LKYSGLMPTADQLPHSLLQQERLRPNETLERLESVLRRDLKLGADIPIQHDTPLIGGEHDLDSLDILMLLTSVEKEFDIKIPNEEVRRDIFKTVGTMADYIDERRR
jgi:acyl carrier protein